jgi:hypothetical protein
MIVDERMVIIVDGHGRRTSGSYSVSIDGLELIKISMCGTGVSSSSDASVLWM